MRISLAFVVATFLFFSTSVVAQLVCPADAMSTGTALPFGQATSNNLCSLDVGNGFVAAIDDSLWDGSARCGECLLVDGPEGSVLVRIIDQCPECSPGDLDLSDTAFEQIADPMPGGVPIQWRYVECPVDGPVRYKLQDSNPFFYRIQVRNHRYGVTDMEYFDGSVYVPMIRTNDNYFQTSDTVPNIDNVSLRIRSSSNEWLQDVLGSTAQTGEISGAEQFAFCDSIFVDSFES